MLKRPLRVGIIGCGAIVEHGHLPAAAKSTGARIQMLIDRDRDRASSLANRWNIPHAGTGIEELVGRVDAAIVATPHHLHASIASWLLKRGIPVLVEKPMGLSVSECDEMLDASEEGEAPLGVGFVCRFSRAAKMTKTLLDNGTLGAVRSFHAENGCVFAWPVVSDFLFRRETAGGGVLMDLGSHVLDLLMWWLGPVADVEHFDDSFGGVEADSFTRLKMKNGSCGTVRLSRTCRLEQGIFLECERGSLYLHLGRPALDLRFEGSPFYLESDVREHGGEKPSTQDFVELLAAQLDDWTGAVAAGRAPATDGRTGRQTVALIEQCYTQRQRWRLPWMA